MWAVVAHNLLRNVPVHQSIRIEGFELLTIQFNCLDDHIVVDMPRCRARVKVCYPAMVLAPSRALEDPFIKVLSALFKEETEPVIKVEKLCWIHPRHTMKSA